MVMETDRSQENEAGNAIRDHAGRYQRVDVTGTFVIRQNRLRCGQTFAERCSFLEGFESLRALRAGISDW